MDVHAVAEAIKPMFSPFGLTLAHIVMAVTGLTFAIMYFFDPEREGKTEHQRFLTNITAWFWLAAAICFLISAFAWNSLRS